MTTHSIRTFIRGDFLDAYIYGGHIFAISRSGHVKTTPILGLAETLQERNRKHRTPLNLALVRNDWLTNPQAASIYQSSACDQFWEQWTGCARSSKRSPHLYEVLDEDLTWDRHFEIQHMPAYDIRIYGMKLFVADRTGLYESQVHISERGPERVTALEPRRVFDARAVSISAKSGSIAISADKEGLFHGTLWSNQEAEETLRVEERRVAAKSLRSAWSGYNLINYDHPGSFTYLENEVQKDTGKRPFFYSAGDEGPEQKVRVTQLAKQSIPLEEARSDIDRSEIRFCFNSAAQCFFVMNDGSYLTQTIDYQPGGLRLRRPVKLPPVGKSRVISACTVPLGTVLEHFDEVSLAHNAEVTRLENGSAIAVRTFPAARRYRRLILIIREDGLVIHSIPPSDAEVRKLQEW